VIERAGEGGKRGRKEREGGRGMGMGVENGEDDAVLVMVATKPGDGVEMMKKTGRSVQELATVVGDLMVDMASAIRSGGRQSFLEQTQGAMQVHAQRLKQVTRRIGADAVQWMHQGGLWRSVLVMSVSILHLPF
jgi:hypothetical protein